MKKLYTCSFGQDADLLANFLNAEGIETTVNKGPNHPPEVWIVKDEDDEESAAILNDWLELQKQPTSPITPKRRLVPIIFATISLLFFGFFLVLEIVNIFHTT